MTASANESVPVPSNEEAVVEGVQSNPVASSLESLFRQFMEKVANSAVPSTSSVVPNSSVEAVPEFGGVDLGEDANRWCNLIETITVKLSHVQRLSLATHALKGPARKWYQGWEGNPRTWAKFREDLCSVFVSEDRLCERLTRAMNYTSDSANSYSEYARNKLKYYEQTQIAFKPHELVSFVIGSVTDPFARQSLANSQYKTTAELLSGISQFVKTPKVEKERSRDDNGHASKYNLSRKPCYECSETGHLRSECSKRRRPDTNLSRDLSKRSAVPTCGFCYKRGHDESKCWTKQRTHRENPKQASVDRNKLEANACRVKELGLTPILLCDLMVQCLLDSGADRSMVRESIAKQANCKIEPYYTAVRGLGGGSVSVIGQSTILIQAGDAAAEVNFLVVPDSAMSYDAILGEDILDYEDLCVKKINGEKKLLHFPSKRVDVNVKSNWQCNVTEMLSPEIRQPLEALLAQFERMIITGHNLRTVSTGELKIVLKEDKTVRYQPYRLSFSQREKVREIVSDLLENNIIRESSSPFASPIILVSKANGDVRMCVDYRSLNKITVKDRYPLPLIDDQLDRLGKGKYFTTLDMASGFH